MADTDTDTAADAAARARTRFGRQRELERAVGADLVARLGRLEDSITHFAAHLRGLMLNDVLGAELVVIPTAGVVSRDFSVPFASVAVLNHSTATITVAAHAPQGNAPPSGPGVHLVGPGAAEVINLTGPVWTIYGPAGAQVSVSTFAKPQPPGFGTITNVNTPAGQAVWNDGDPVPAAAEVGAMNQVWDTPGNVRFMRSIRSIADGDTGAWATGSGPLLYTGAGFNRERTPAAFKANSATLAGNSALWTPAAGKKFRLLRYMVVVTGDAAQAVAGTFLVQLLDGAAGSTAQAHYCFIPGAALNGATLYHSGWIDLGNGILSAAANNVLNMNLQNALTSGKVLVIACGTEE
ncbi:MAG: hypothetical protein ACJ72N_21960 [Labedaea sp.]